MESRTSNDSKATTNHSKQTVIYTKSTPSKRQKKMSTDDAEAEAYEQAHVHSIYAAIAPHFSATRQRPWPRVSSFLKAQPAGAVGVDIGCGNGKYLSREDGVVVVGLDRSAELVGLARGRCGGTADEAVVADGLAPPFVAGRADFALCVAVAHHLSTAARRRDLLRWLLLCLRARSAGGRALVCVWALEQAGSRRGWDQGDLQDRFVPWVVSGDAVAMGQAATTYQRYYHLYRRGELEADVEAAGGRVEEAGYERDNWWVICSRA